MKRIILCLICTCLTTAIFGCSIKESKTKKLKDLEFTVVEREDLPEELITIIDEKKDKPMKLTYGDKGYLYIVIGYGSQETSGYSIEVTELYESSNAVYIHTNLLGPSKQEQVESIVTYPYVTAKIENIEKKVVFN